MSVRVSHSPSHAWPECRRATATKLRKAGIFSRVDDSNTSIGKRYARNDELGTPFGVTLDFACRSLPECFETRPNACLDSDSE